MSAYKQNMLERNNGSGKSDREVLGDLGQLENVDVIGQLLVGLHGGGVDIEDLSSSFFLRQSNLHLGQANKILN